MNMGERRKSIVEMVDQAGTISFTELKTRFSGVSEMTLRRDLEFLDSAKQIIRIHGGAKSVDMIIGTDDLFSKRSLRNAEAKKEIVAKAVQLLKPNTSIYLDSGTTVTELAKVVPDIPSLIFTSSITAAVELSKLSQPQLSLIGGRVNKYSLSIAGTRSLAFLQNVNLDICFLGTTGYAPGQGFTIGAEEEYELKREIIRRTEKVVMLMDSKKIGYAYTFTIAQLSEVDVIVSDGMLDEETLRDFRQNGITVL